MRPEVCCTLPARLQHLPDSCLILPNTDGCSDRCVQPIAGYFAELGHSLAHLRPSSWALSPFHLSSGLGLPGSQSSALTTTIPQLGYSAKQLMSLLQSSPRRVGEKQRGTEICLSLESQTYLGAGHPSLGLPFRKPHLRGQQVICKSIPKG